MLRDDLEPLPQIGLVRDPVAPVDRLRAVTHQLHGDRPGYPGPISGVQSCMDNFIMQRGDYAVCLAV